MADTNQTIQDFYTQALKRDFARDFNFRLTSILSPQGLFDFSDRDLVYLKAAKLPERAITNVPVPYMGLKFNVPGNATYPNSEGYQLQFYADAKSKIRQAFEDWTRTIFDDKTSTGNYFVPGRDSIIDMIQLDEQFKEIAHYKLIGVSVLNCGPLEYKIAEGVGNTVEFTATISYHYWTRTSPGA